MAAASRMATSVAASRGRPLFTFVVTGLKYSSGRLALEVIGPSTTSAQKRRPGMAKTFVVGVDGTADSLAALAAAATMAEESGADLDVVHVRHGPALTSVGEGSGGAAAAESDALDEMEQTSRQRASDVLAGRHVQWRFDVAVGDPATELVAAARAQNAATIVVGGRNHGV